MALAKKYGLSQEELKELESEVAELKEQLSILKPHPLCNTSCLLSCSMEADYAEKQYLENQQLQASNNNLREAGQALIDRWDSPKWVDNEHTGVFIDALRKAIAATPAESLQAHDDDVIASITQSLTDPENQPSQFGTVPLSWYENIENNINRIRFNVESIIDSLDGSYEKHAIRKQLKAAIDDEALKEGK